MSAIETEQSVQSARMDTFTSLPEGSTSGNAELADIRVGADGTTYDTAGNAVRGQISELKSDLTDLADGYAVLNLVKNSYLETDGTITTYNDWSRTDYVAVEKKVRVYTDHETNYCGFFDSSKVFVQNAQIRVGWNELTVPAGASFFMASNKTSRMATVKIQVLWMEQIEDLFALNDDRKNELEAFSAYTIYPSGTDDLTTVIEAALQKYGEVRLLSGNYYTTGITMPLGSKIYGNGADTKLYLLPSADDGACIIPSGDNVIENIAFYLYGGNQQKPTYSNIVPIDGIRILNEASLCRVVGCDFYGFKRAGVYGNTVGHSSYQSIIIDDCRFMYCEIGVYFDYFTEYATVSNSYFSQCYNGIRNDAGNNLFIGCHFDGNNSAFAMITYNISGANDGHGSCVGCTFNHSDNYAVYVRGGSHGFVFVGCHFYYGAIYLRSCTGIVFDSCQSDGTGGIIFYGGNGHRFVNMSFVATPAITVESGTPQNIRFINCYLLDGSAEVTYQSA